MHPLNDPRLTLAHAREHLDHLESAVSTHQVLKLDALARQFDAQNRCYIFRYQLPGLPTWRVALQVGDVVHNLRASLDHLAWRLARLTVKVPSTRVAFPVFEQRNA